MKTVANVNVVLCVHQQKEYDAKTLIIAYHDFSKICPVDNDMFKTVFIS